MCKKCAIYGNQFVCVTKDNNAKRAAMPHHSRHDGSVLSAGVDFNHIFLNLDQALHDQLPNKLGVTGALAECSQFV